MSPTHKREKYIDMKPRVPLNDGTGVITRKEETGREYPSNPNNMPTDPGITLIDPCNTLTDTNKTPIYDRDQPRRYNQSTGLQMNYRHDEGNDYSCVDLKSMAKLKKLCHLLKMNLIELRTVYKERLDLGYSYTKSERVSLDTGLQSLDNNVLMLFDKLEEICGYRKEIKDVVNMYNLHESEYRYLKSLNKKAKFRNYPQFFKSSKFLRNKATNKDEDFITSWPSIIINCLCHPCLNEQRRRKK